MVQIAFDIVVGFLALVGALFIVFLFVLWYFNVRK